MARKVRVEYAGACYHVLNRGNYRRDLFTGDGAKRSFEKCLFEACGAYGWRLHAFVIMANHFHLALETPEPNLSLGMKWLQGTWAARFNRFRGVNGRPFQGRYKALHVEPGHALAQVAHYIHLNPVRAGVVPIEKLHEYRGSSLQWFLRKKRPGLFEAATILAESGGLSDDAVGWGKYIDYLAVIAEEEAKLREERFGRLSRGWLIGSKEFRASLQKELQGQVGRSSGFELLGADRAAQEQSRCAFWEGTLRKLAVAFDVSLDRLPQLRSAEEKLVLATAMKTVTSVSNRWLAEHLQMGKMSSIGALLRRFRLQGKANAAQFKDVLSRFTT